MSNDAAVQEVLRRTIGEKLGSADLELFTANGRENFNFGAATENLTQILFRFWKAHGRMPNVIFNDGIPPSWRAALEKTPGLMNAVFGYYKWLDTYRPGEGENYSGVQEVDVRALMVFNCKLMPRPGVKASYQYINRISMDQELIETVTVDVIGPQHGRMLDIGAVPRVDFLEGAFQTWGLLLIAITHPQYLYASDEGFMLTMDGVGMIERSPAHWLWVALHSEFGLPDDATIAAQLGSGPFMIGIPATMVDSIRKEMQAAKRAGHPAMMIAKWVISMVGFYFGAAAASGLVGGAFTLPNLSGAVSLVNKFGIDTGNLSSILKVAGSLTGNVDFSSYLPQSGAAMDDYDLWADIGINPDTIVPFETAFPDFGDFGDFGAGVFVPDDLGGYDLFADIGISPDSVDSSFQYVFDDSNWDVAQDAMANVTGDWGPPAEDYNASEILAENNAALERAGGGPVSVTQYAAVAKATPQVAAAVQAANRQTGGAPSSTSTTPSQAARAASVAHQNANQLVAAGNPAAASIWSTAGQVLSLYSQYQQIQARKQTGLPSSIRYPTNSTPVRQPDGSFSVRNADGTVTTIRPNGQTVTTPANVGLPGFLAQNKTALIIGGIAIAGVGLVLAMRNR
jgi:hypothetical protein